MRSQAPVAFFAYRRPDHARKALDALRRNVLAERTPLHIFIDGPKTSAEEREVAAVRELAARVQGFRDVYVVFRERNMGLAASIVSGVSAVVEEYGEVIVVEDDLVTSPFFLQFMNDALEMYRDEDRVVSIHGYMFPLRQPLPETFLLYYTGCWGWATWRRGWSFFEPDGRKLLDRLRQRGTTRRFDFDDSYPFTEMLEGQIGGRNDSWAIRWQASAFLNDKLTLFPGRSLVRNIGTDRSGTHSASGRRFDVVLADEPVTVSRIEVREDLTAREWLVRYFASLQPSALSKWLHHLKASISGR